MLPKKIIDAIDNAKTTLDKAVLKAFIRVESGGRGFDPNTGKIMIQFEPRVFSRQTGIEISHNNTFKWDENHVEVQSKEWKAFNEAFGINPNAAMESTSIGLPQIMGFHWKRLGYKSVGEMWDDFKISETNQVKGLEKFIRSDARLLKAFEEKDWHMMAYVYNGAGYAAQAYKLGYVPYNEQLKRAYENEISSSSTAGVLQSR